MSWGGEAAPTLANPNRVVVLIDLDCFYAQVEHVRLGIPSTEPLAVVQWNLLVAVNYAAREFGIKRGQDNPRDAKKKCRKIHLVHVELIDPDGNATRDLDPKMTRKATRERMDYYKASLAPYRRESLKIVEIFQRYAVVEKGEFLLLLCGFVVFVLVSFHLVVPSIYWPFSRFPSSHSPRLPLSSPTSTQMLHCGLQILTSEY